MLPLLYKKKRESVRNDIFNDLSTFFVLYENHYSVSPSLVRVWGWIDFAGKITTKKGGEALHA